MDMKAFASVVLPELHRRLSPMNIQVTSKVEPWKRDLLFRFECEVRISGHFFNGQKITIDRLISYNELYHQLSVMRDEKLAIVYAVDYAARESREIIRDFYEYFSETIPEAPELDYRPQEMIPEDFYTS